MKERWLNGGNIQKSQPYKINNNNKNTSGLFKGATHLQQIPFESIQILF